MPYQSCTIRRFAAGVLVFVFSAGAQEPEKERPLAIHLQADAGVPLRLYLTHRVSYRQNESVTAKLIEPVWSFDRIVIPAGTIAQGKITALTPVPTMMRIRALLGGDFTPLKKAQVTFTSLTFADGRSVEMQALPSLGLGTYYIPPRPSKSKKAPQAKTQPSNAFVAAVKQQIQGQMSAKSQGIYDLVRGPNKREWIEDFLLNKLPYHPQWYRSGMRINSILSQPVDFGGTQLLFADAKSLGLAPPPDSTVQMRINETVTSADAKVGDPLRGVLAQPLFNGDHKLILPQGTLITGKITLAQPARLFHRTGKLRFAFESFQLGPETAEYVAAASAPKAVRAQVAQVERTGAAGVKVDQEGTVTTTESKTRLLRPLIAGIVAAKTLDNDAGRQTTGSADGNAGGRATGGFSGFGLLGTLAARGPSQIGEVLGFYGLGWSVYTNVVARGTEVSFEKYTEMTIRFGSPARAR